MAVTIKDIIKLKTLQNFKLLAGEKGMDNTVISAGLLDYEFLDDVDYKLEGSFDKNSFVISSFLFAKDNHKLLLPAIKKLMSVGVSGLAYKTVIFEKLPDEVITFANNNNFPIFKFGEDIFFENIIFDIMEAVQLEDNMSTSEDNIRKMIEFKLTRQEVKILSRSISLSFKKNAMVIYATPLEHDKPIELIRIIKSFLLNKIMREKAMLCTYKKGLVIIITSESNDATKFELILIEILEYIGLTLDNIKLSYSNIHPAYEELDYCLKESYYAFISSLIEKQSKTYYDKIGTYKFLIPQLENEEISMFMSDYLKPILSQSEQIKTAIQFILSKGNIDETASRLICHKNTVRYRINKLHEIIDPTSTDMEFYEKLSTSIKIYLLKQQ